MVQFGSGREWDPEISNDFWKLRKYDYDNRERMVFEVSELGYKTTSKPNRRRLIDLSTRAQRKLLNYDACTKEELVRFCFQRGFKSKANRATLVSKLEAADDETTFDRFLDLPAELRLQIYTEHFKSLVDGPLSGPTAPPITGVSRLVREESLPLFYQTCEFVFEICIWPDEECHQPAECSMSYLRVSQEQRSMLRKVTIITVNTMDEVLEGKLLWRKCTIDFGSAGKKAKILGFSNQMRTSDREIIVRARHAAANTVLAIKRCLDVVDSRPGGKGLMVGDIFELMQAFDCEDCLEVL